MQNFKDLLNRFSFTFKTIESNLISTLLNNQFQIDSVFRLLSDDDSKYVYAQDVMITLLLNVINLKTAIYFTGSMNEEVWNNALKSASQYDIFNKFICPNRENANYIKASCIAESFIFRQYDYKNIIKIL